MTIMFIIILLITVVVLNSCEKKSVPLTSTNTSVPQMKLVCESPWGYVYIYYHEGRNIYVYENHMNAAGSGISVH